MCACVCCRRHSLVPVSIMMIPVLDAQRVHELETLMQQTWIAIGIGALSLMSYQLLRYALS